MDKKLQILSHLYGEEDDGAVLRALLEEDDVRQEYQAFSEAKFWLDHTKRVRPDAVVLDRIFDAARDGLPPEPPVGRADRAPVQRTSRMRRRWIGLGVTGSLLAVLALVWLVPGTPSGPLTSRQAAPESATVDAETTDRAVLQKAEPAGPSFVAGAPRADDLDATTDSLVPAAPGLTWDQQNEIMRVQRRLEFLESRSGGLAWDRPAVPLESLPNAEAPQPTLYPGARPQQARSRNQ